MIVSAASLGILPQPPVSFQIFDWWRVRITVVEITDFLSYVN
jgi:hypothetical protein